MNNKRLAVYLMETGRTDHTERVDILTPRDEKGDEIIVSVDSSSITISRLSGIKIVELKQIILSEVE